MMGVPIDGPTQIFCDNNAVVKSTTRPESTLKKRQIRYINISWIESGQNIADVLTKALVGDKQRELIRRILYT
jgi:hypothetical protein